MKMLNLECFDTKHPLYSSLEEFGLPKRNTEQYRQFPVSTLLKRDYNWIRTEQTDFKDGSKLVIKNGKVTEAPAGVHVKYMTKFEADQEHYDAVYFMSHMLSDNIILLDVVSDTDIELEHIFAEETALLTYRIVLNVAPGVHVSVHERFQTHSSNESLMLYGIDANLSHDSSLHWIRFENRQTNEASIIGTHRFLCEKDTLLTLDTFDFGSVNSLHLYKIDLYEHAFVDAAHLLVATQKAKRGNVVHINHKGESAKSTQKARSIIKEEAVGIFDAKILVGNDGKHASAMQNSKAILLDEHARMYAKPQLEIYIDELEASHGSTIGTLDEEMLFYLQSRGIKKDEARQMLVLAFANSFIERVNDEAVRNELHHDFEKLI